MHLIIFSTILTPRIKYIINFIFKDILKTEVEFTGNSTHFKQSSAAKISYGDQPLADELFFKSSPLLYSSKTTEISIKTTSFDNDQVPFPVNDSALPFDIFAASFFILTRYEEYLHAKTNDGHFKAAKSLQSKLKILDRPIIDEWALILKRLIKKKYPEFKFPEKTFHHQITLNLTLVSEIPEGFLPKTKFVFSTLFKKENHYLRSKFDEFTGVGARQEKVIEDVEKLCSNQKKYPHYFIHFPDLPADYIRKNGISKQLTNRHVGLLNPCVSGMDKTGPIKQGINKLKKLLPEQTSLISQQLEHLKFPICYLNLLNQNIVADYSMGYADTGGFRAGTCTPFNWYDLQLEKVTPLMIHSYCIADETLKYLPVNEGWEKISQYLEAVKAVQGSFYSVWNLKSLSSGFKYKNLSVLFNKMLNQTEI